MVNFFPLMTGWKKRSSTGQVIGVIGSSGTTQSSSDATVTQPISNSSNGAAKHNNSLDDNDRSRKRGKFESDNQKDLVQLFHSKVDAKETMPKAEEDDRPLQEVVVSVGRMTAVTKQGRNTTSTIHEHGRRKNLLGSVNKNEADFTSSLSCNNGDAENTPSYNSSSRGNMIMSCGVGGVERWRAHRIAEDYIELVSNVMFPGTYLTAFGYDPASGQYPVEQVTALGLLTSPIRRPLVIEKWSPFEIATFEASLALFGKQFDRVQKYVRTKTTKEIVEFFYIWKKTAHYKVWKKQFKLYQNLDKDDSDSE